MSEVHVAVVREIGGKKIIADVELPLDGIRDIPKWERAQILLVAYESATCALDDKETDQACEEIKNLTIATKKIVKIA